MERFLVTGAFGCIGAWVVHELVRGGRDVVMFDLATEPRRLRLLLGDEADAVAHVAGDITDLAALDAAVELHDVTNVIHLAALQVPLVRADPPLGARVNVVGTTNVFEVATRRGLAPVVYASSIAALDGDAGTAGTPSTLYGVFKRANEQAAQVYFAESGLSSVGLRPHTVYGVGRDQGLTSAPTTAMLAAAAGVPYRIPFGGACQMQLARDVARAFVAASDAGATGASVHNLPAPTVRVADVVAAIGADGIEVDETPLPFPAESDSTSFRALVPDFEPTPLADGVRETVDAFRALLAGGLVEPPG
ncbi:MAG TPA: NAD(P)-dependent oxidoreductase [Gaiellaceae bacterium]|nr:NAD(P)-dependent oxidoreductase [Gaiellaceae bacterium]